MQGTVHIFDTDSDRIAIDTPAGFSIFEVSNGIFSEGDLVSWGPDEPTGAQEITNQSSGHNVGQVDPEAFPNSRQEVKRGELFSTDNAMQHRLRDAGLLCQSRIGSMPDISQPTATSTPSETTPTSVSEDGTKAVSSLSTSVSTEKIKRRKPKTFRVEFPQKDADTWCRELANTPLGAEWNPDLAQVLKTFVAKEFSDYIKRRFGAQQ